MKKNLLLLSAFFIITFQVNAQINKGSVFLGGSLFFTHTSGFATSAYGIAPQLGKTFNENSVIGISLNYGNGTPDNTYNFKDYGGGLFFRKYRPLGKNFYLFGHAQLSYGFLKYSTSANLTDVQTTNQSTYGLSIFPGLSYAFSRKFHIDVTINNLLYISYIKDKINYSSPGSSIDTKSGTFYFSTNNQSGYPLSLGFNFIL